jgi:hypothetical protein
MKARCIKQLKYAHKRLFINTLNYDTFRSGLLVKISRSAVKKHVAVWHPQKNNKFSFFLLKRPVFAYLA